MINVIVTGFNLSILECKYNHEHLIVNVLWF